MKASVLVTGGAGYIGSHMVKRLIREDHGVTVLDNLSTGHRDAIKETDFVEGDLRRPSDAARAFEGRRIDVVTHLAASCYVGESVQDPAKYYANNVVGTPNLLEAMRAAEVHRLVFSSTCSAVVPIPPVNSWDSLFGSLDKFSRDYMADRGQPAQQKRETAFE